MNKHDTGFWDNALPFDHARLMSVIEELSERYSFLEIGYLGNSILGRGIPLLSLGHGQREVLYVGAHHGMEWITSMVLMGFVREFCEQTRYNRTVFRISLPRFLETHTLWIVPMLNPDGVEYQIHGVEENNPLYKRVRAMNNGSSDFSNWQANARGVDLNHNYDAGFVEYKQIELENGIVGGAPTRFSGEFPESEPEVGYLCNRIRFSSSLRGILTLHTQGEEIFYQSGGKSLQKAEALAKRMSLLCNYCLSEATGMASFGGLTDWCVQKQELPSFTIECGKGKNPLPISHAFPIYARLRELLFTFPMMV